jgi:redox-sensitive bicupin YhaK (pirin superfamily)
MRLPGLLLDVSMKKGDDYGHNFPTEWSAFAHIAQGSGTLFGKLVGKEHAVVLGAGDTVKASTDEVRLQLAFVLWQRKLEVP